MQIISKKNAVYNFQLILQNLNSFIKINVVSNIILWIIIILIWDVVKKQMWKE